MTDREKRLRNEITDCFARQFLGGCSREYQECEICARHPEDSVVQWDRERGIVGIQLVKPGAEHVRFTVSAEEFAAERWAEVDRWLQHGNYDSGSWLGHVTTFWGGEFDRHMEGPDGREIINEAARNFVVELGQHLGLDQRIHHCDGAVILGGEKPPQRFESAAKPKPAPSMADLVARIEALEKRLGVNYV